MSKIKFDNKANVTQDMPIKPIKAFNNLVVGEIVSVELTEKVSEAKTGYQFTGFSVPNLVIRFKQKVDAYNKEERYSVWVFKPVVSVKNDLTAMAEDTFSKLVMVQFSHLKHILDAYEGTANFKALGKLPEIDSEADAETLLAQFKAFYEAFIKAFEGKDGNGVYKNLEVTVKFVVNKGEKRLHIPNYVNRGYIQLARFDNKGLLITSLEFYGESIEIPKVIEGNTMPGTTAAMPVNSGSVVNLGDI